MATFAFAGGSAETPGYGQRHKIRYTDTWAAGDDWTISFVSTLLGSFTLGKGNIAKQTYTCALKLRNRMYIGFGSNFALSENGDVTGWEEQNSGAAVIPFLSQFGQQDSIKAFASLQGRLVVIGRFSSQIWSIDADPSNFVLQQTLDNTGTRSLLSVKSIGDLDVLYLDDSGVRSMRAKESTLNAFVSDIGTAIDLTIRKALIGYDASLACAVVEPSTKQYWLFLNGNIYVLSNYPESKIVAWSTYKPQYQSTVAPDSGTYNGSGIVVYSSIAAGAYYWVKGANDTSFETTDSSGEDAGKVLTSSGGLTIGDSFVVGTARGTPSAAYTGTLYKVDNTFTPSKIVVFNGQIYIRGSDRKIYRYGGSDNNTFDHCKTVVELPWLDLKEPSMRKQMQGLDAAFTGHWLLATSTNPRASSLVAAIDRGSQTAPSMVEDSTFDVGRFAVSGIGTHIKIKATTYTDGAAKLGKLSVVYKAGGDK
jgi:hypothetical protein